jgi:hypothetical protein
MRFSRMRLPCTLGPAVAAIAVFAMLALPTPASAAGEDFKGWFVALDLATTQPNSLDQHFANHIDTTVTPPRVERLVIDNKTDFTYKVSAGYSWGGSLGSLKVSYWSFDNDDKMTDTLAGYVNPTIFGFGYTNYGMYVSNPAGVTYTATSKVKASTTDLDYIRPIATSEKNTLSWLAGLRVASYEEDQGFFGNDNLGGYYYQNKHIESNGVGLRVGAAAEFGFTPHFGLVSSAVFSFLQADLEGNSSQQFGSAGTPETMHSKDNNIRGEMRDFDVKAVWSYGPLDYWLGFSTSSWGGMVADPLPALGGGPLAFGLGPAESRGRDNISFNSLHAGVKWRFGKKSGLPPI